MALVMDKAALKAAEEAIAAKQDEANPFVREGDNTFIRYDSIRIIQQQSHHVLVEFLWRGSSMCSMHSSCDFARGESLTLSGVRGSIPVMITSETQQ